ncbi:AcvB/VirJ family lysyl-phosphatidylglycerol hydrolase [Sphingobium aromaticiconvertens]|uniref:AcvB/VirJ family lysyl-phosphatidylglycerol hydrolase n=1 Tax=Sphingobium aromaticiconvertens TaxID=365341 RepID=UPI00301B35F7
MTIKGKRSTRRIAIAFAGIFLAILATFAWLGYLGGDPFSTLRPAQYQPHVNAPVAILLSGDMGFKVGMGPRVAQRLVHDGVPVVGVNSLTYFRVNRTSQQATALLVEAIHRALTIDPQSRLMLVGQSYGADMLHVGLAGLPASLRQRIALVALVVPGATVENRASPSEILTFAMAEALPTARRLDWVPLLCVYGVEETGSLCPLLHQPNAQTVGLPGGHPLHGDANAVYHAIRSAMAQAGLGVGR